VTVILKVNIFFVSNNHQRTLTCIKIVHNWPKNCENDRKLAHKNGIIRSRFIKTTCLLKIIEYRYENFWTLTHKNVLINRLHSKKCNIESHEEDKVDTESDDHHWEHQGQQKLHLGRRKNNEKNRREVYDYNAVKIRLSNDIETNPGPNNPVNDLIVNKKNLFVWDL